MDVNFETMEDVTYDNYIEMITNKTGVLSAASFKIGALIADAKEEEQNIFIISGNILVSLFKLWMII
jgi:geranylgeranyl diphosphate synthase type II